MILLLSYKHFSRQIGTVCALSHCELHLPHYGHELHRDPELMVFFLEKQLIL